MCNIDIDTFKSDDDPDDNYMLTEINTLVNVYIVLPDIHKGKSNYGIYHTMTK